MDTGYISKEHHRDIIAVKDGEIQSLREKLSNLEHRVSKLEYHLVETQARITSYSRDTRR